MKQLIDIGSPDAPRGSEPWCRSFHQAICRLKREGQFAVSNLKYSLRDFHDGEHFKRLADEGGSPFKAWKRFVEAPEPYGLGMPVTIARAIMEEADDSKLLRDVLGKPGGDHGNQYTGGKRQRANGTLPRGSNSRAYIAARLDRDGHTELADKVRAKTITVREAVAEAGIKFKQPTALDVLRRAWAKASPAERRAFMAEVAA